MCFCAAHRLLRSDFCTKGLRAFSAGLYVLHTTITFNYNMKHITKLSPNHYIQLDSYGDRPMSGLSKFLCTTFVLFIAATTAGALVGIDITNINPGENQEQSK